MASSITLTLLREVSSPNKLRDLVARRYANLRRIAGQLLKHERPSPTLQPTVLVHEMFLRWTSHPPKPFKNLHHFLGSASRQMQEIMIDRARRRTAAKRGGSASPLPLEDLELPVSCGFENLDMTLVLERLRAADPRAARIVQLHIWEGREWAEIASLLAIGESTARREWAAARAWLQAALERQP